MVDVSTMVDGTVPIKSLSVSHSSVWEDVSKVLTGSVPPATPVCNSNAPFLGCSSSFNLFTNGLHIMFLPGSLTLLESFQSQSLQVPLLVTLKYIPCTPTVSVELRFENVQSGIIFQLFCHQHLVVV